MSSIAAPQSQNRIANVATWVLRIFLAVAFLAAAGAKLAGVPMMVDIFNQIGIGQWFRYLTAIVEIIGAVALFIPGLTAAGAGWLGATMVGAVLTHLFVLHSSPVPALVLLVLAAITVWLNRDQLAALRARFFELS